ncbi:MAG: hypothetical protein IJ407_03435 [Clostridia bacterium]|nr:hypothetical protein [Clostridia bacterium]
MKMKKWIALLLIALMTLTMVCSCKSNKDDGGSTAAIDDFVEQDDTDINDDDINSTPAKDDDEPADEDTKEPADDKNDEDSKEDESADDKKDEAADGKEDSPTDEDSKDPADDQNEEPADDKTAPVEKESSGVKIKMLSQNLKTSGNQKNVLIENTRTGIYFRTRRFKSLVKAQDPDIIFAQECTPAWIEYFQEDEYFKNTYTMVWHYAAEGVTAVTVPSCTPVLYKTAKYEELNQGYFWLSETPKSQSLSFGATSEGDYRISSWVKLKVKGSDEEFYCYSTHYALGDAESVIPSTQLYIDLFNEMDPDAYAFVGGDMNTYYRQAGYQGMMDFSAILDLRDMAMNMYDDSLCTLGGMGSGHNLAFEAEAADLPAVNYKTPQIDYIMAKPNPNMALDYYGFDYTTYGNTDENVQPGHISDHFGLVAEVRINTNADYSQYQVEHDYGNNPVYFET